jgi:hypothetical protein
MRIPNFRRYIIGQSISHTGQWFQNTAELWFILALTGSGTACTPTMRDSRPDADALVASTASPP